MSKVDWSLAPGGATHYAIGSPDPWRDYSGIDALFFSTLRRTWDRMSLSSATCIRSELPKEERPQPKPWSGPEDGFPSSSWCSVGKMVQVMSLPTHHHEDVSIYLSKPSKIVASYTDDDGDSFLMLRIDCDFGTGYECFAAHRVLPAKTEKQIAADKRETAIRELMDIAQVDCRVTAARLVDAGFKREVV